MENHRTPQSNEVVNHQAKELVGEHFLTIALKATNKEQSVAAVTYEDKAAIEEIHEHIVDLDHANILEARKFAEENLPQLRNQATQEATAAGKKS